MAKDIGDRFYCLNSSLIASIVANITAAVISSSALATVSEAIAIPAKILMEHQTSEFNSEYKGVVQLSPQYPCHHYYNTNT